MLRKLALTVALFVLPSLASADWTISQNSKAFNQLPSAFATLLTSVTATGAGTAFNLAGVTGKFTCTITWGGTTPTNTVIYLEGSIDGTVYATIANETVTATGQTFHVVNKPVAYIRGNYVSKTGGDTDTAVTMKCLGGGN